MVKPVGRHCPYGLGPATIIGAPTESAAILLPPGALSNPFPASSPAAFLPAERTHLAMATLLTFDMRTDLDTVPHDPCAADSCLLAAAAGG
jgi:hypothetical protein